MVEFSKYTDVEKIKNLVKEIAELKLKLKEEENLEEEEREYLDLNDVEILYDKLESLLYNSMLEVLSKRGYLDLSDGSDEVYEFIFSNTDLDFDSEIPNIVEEKVRNHYNENSSYIVFYDETPYGDSYEVVFKKVEGLKYFGQYLDHYGIFVHFPNFELETDFFSAYDEEVFSEKGAEYKLKKFIEDLKHIDYVNILLYNFGLYFGETTEEESLRRILEGGYEKPYDLTLEALDEDNNVVLEVLIDRMDFAKDLYM